MATKLKNIRSLLCGLSFFLGLSILLSIGCMWNNPNYQLSHRLPYAFNLLSKPDFQDTDFFKEDLLNDLSQILSRMQEYDTNSTKSKYERFDLLMDIRQRPEIATHLDRSKFLYAAYIESDDKNPVLLAANDNVGLREYAKRDVPLTQNGVASDIYNVSSVSEYGYDGYDYGDLKNGSSSASSEPESVQPLPLEGYNLSIVLKDGKFEIIRNNGKLSTEYFGPEYFGAASSADLIHRMTDLGDRPYLPGIKRFELYVSVLREQPVDTDAYQGYLSARLEAQNLLSIFIPAAVASVVLLLLCLIFRKQWKLFNRRLAAFSGKVPKALRIAALCVCILSFIVFFFSFWPSRGTSLTVLSCLVFIWTLYLAVNDWYFKKISSPKESSTKLKIFLNRIADTRRKRALKKPLSKRLISRLTRFCVLELITFSLLLGITYGGRFSQGPGRGLALPLLLLIALSVALLVCLSFPYFRRFRHTMGELQQISDQIHKIRNGDYASTLSLPGQSELKPTEEDLNDLQAGMSAAVEEQVHAERMKVDLIANVSHDIKTPLTSIISYVDLLQKEEGLSPHVRDYIKILAAKSERLKLMVQDVFELSKATSGNMQLYPEFLDLNKLIRQTLADMDEEVSSSSLLFRVLLPEEPVILYADGGRLYRVYQNLIKNALQYSLEHSRVYIEITTREDRAAVSIKNISKYELASLHEDILERFVRGDASRTTEGSGLGLSIAKTFTEACGGVFQLSTDADLFTVTTEFPFIQPAPDPFSGAQ